MKGFLYSSTILIAVISLSDTASGSICKPLSTFKLDCNVCQCSSSGREYTCTEKFCPPRDEDRFLQEENDEGFIILKPKAQRFDDSDEDIVLRKPKSRLEPYINDEIDPLMNNGMNRENDDDEEDDDEEADRAQIEDISLERDVENWDEDNYDTVKRMMYRTL